MSMALVTSTSEMDSIFSETAELQSWLDFESALARAQAQLGVIPVESAERISAHADAENFDIERIRDEIRISVHPIMPIVANLSAICGDPAGQYVHWGATTQDVLDTGLVLRLKRAHQLLLQEVDKVLQLLLERAAEERSTVMPGRTHGQHAVPITLGYKLAVYADELMRGRHEISTAGLNMLTGQLGGAAGTLSSLGGAGLEVRQRLMKELDLLEPAITWHASRDRFAKYAFALALVASTLHRLGREIMELQRDEIGELFEPFHHGKIGSSTMPHKRNPSMSETLITLGELVHGTIPVALAGMGSVHERDKGVYSVEHDYLVRVCSITHRMLLTAVTVLHGMSVDRDRMRANLDLTGGAVFSENVQMVMAEVIGRQRAHDLIYDVAMDAYEAKIAFRDAIQNHSMVRELSEDDRSRLFDIEAVKASSEKAVDSFLASARREILEWKVPISPERQ